ncbi:MAG: hypothetical protein MJ211_02920 [Bacteroidales bacterium]|nr:hypothetical protein [Bacteroidales bacterium]
MFLNLYTQQISVFLASVSPDMVNFRQTLKSILVKAGLSVIESNENGDYDTELNIMKNTDCSIHILGNSDIYNSNNSFASTHYKIAKDLRNNNYKMFLWNPLGYITENNKYINEIKRDIAENTIYSDLTSKIVFVEDLRSIMNTKSQVTSKTEKADILFIFNSLDHDTSLEIVGMLEDIQTIIKLEVDITTNTDYAEFISRQIQNCKLGIIYFDYAEDWAESFAQQIWKNIGGNSSKVPLLFVANSKHANTENFNQLKKIIPLIVNEKSILPLDIKMYYDNILENNKK